MRARIEVTLLSAILFASLPTMAQSVVIKGVITNLAKARERVALVKETCGSDQYLQLVLLGPGGSTKAQTDEKGCPSTVSNLPKVPMPATASKGAFSIECKGLEGEGMYVVAVQKFGPQLQSFLMKDGKLLVIQRSQVKPGSTVDMGEVTILIRPVPGLP